MRKDFKLALVLAVAAIPAGFAVTEAIEAFSAFKAHPFPAFVASSLVTFLLLAFAVIIAIRGDKQTTKDGKRRMTPLAIMIVSGLSFFGAFLWYVWPDDASRVPSPGDERPWKHSLESLYGSDFGVLSFGGEERIHIENKTENLNADVKVLVRVLEDFQSNSCFIAWYVPASSDFRVSDLTESIIRLLADHSQPTLEKMMTSIRTSTSAPGMGLQSSDELVFSKTVYVYTPNPLTITVMGDLTKYYHERGLSLQIRGEDYWKANKDR